VKTIKDAGGIASYHAADVSKPEEVEALITNVVETYGRLGYAFNNARIEGQMAARRIVRSRIGTELSRSLSLLFSCV
jgi:NAD(P)-dependent dehydrogenase (short-subunit alcohol dehydrogenase family)